MRRAWVVRAGDDTGEIDALRAAGRVGVRYPEIGDARVLTSPQIEYELSRTHPGQSAQLRSILLRFTFDVQVGDLVVTPNVAERELWVSVVTGPYEYSDDPLVAGYNHTRSIDSLGWLDRDNRMLQNKLKYIDTPGAVLELRDPDWWFDEFAFADLPHDRVLRSRRAPVPHSSARSSSSRSTPAARKTPAPKPPEHVLCAGSCGLQWRPSSLVDGLCPDCRGD